MSSTFSQAAAGPAHAGPALGDSDALVPPLPRERQRGVDFGVRCAVGRGAGSSQREERYLYELGDGLWSLAEREMISERVAPLELQALRGVSHKSMCSVTRGLLNIYGPRGAVSWRWDEADDFGVRCAAGRGAGSSRREELYLYEMGLGCGAGFPVCRVRVSSHRTSINSPTTK